MESSLGLVGRQLDKVGHALESAGKRMNLAVQAVGNRIDALEQEPVGRQGPGGSNVDQQKMEEGFREVFERITNLDKAMKEAKSENSPGVVKFGSLGISSLKEADAWVDANIDSASVGLIIDPHTLMENLNASISGGDFLKKFETIYKLQIETLSQGYAMSSFERAVPKILCTGQAKVIKSPASFFDKVTTWEDWCYPDTGHLATIREHMSNFVSSHRAAIDSNLEAGKAGHTTAMLSLTASESIVEGLFTFMDEYMKHLTTAKFDVRRAFHLSLIHI